MPLTTLDIAIDPEMACARCVENNIGGDVGLDGFMEIERCDAKTMLDIGRRHVKNDGLA